MDSTGWRRYISLSRLAAGAVVVALALVPAYIFLIDDAEAPQGIERARLLETPRIAGRDLNVGVKQGQLAPDFEISAPDGARTRLSELRGRAVLINFWALWCTSCVAEMPDIDALQARLGRDSFSVLAVNAGESPSRAQEFIDFLDAPFIYGLDIDLTVADAYGVYGLPLSVFIDSTGVVQAVYRGHASAEVLERFTKAAISAQPATAPPIGLGPPISTIPRDRVLNVTRTSSGLSITSKSLRCDATYCSRDAITPLERVPGMRSLRHDPDAVEPSLVLQFDVAVVTETAVLDAVKRALAASNDPVYDGEFVIKLVS